MPSGHQPSVRFRRIGRACRAAREAAGLTNDVAARRYGRSKGWLSTLENGLHIITPEELGDLLDFYRVPHDAERESLIHLAEHGHGKNWDRPFENRVSASLRDLASLEEDASDIRTFGPD